ncbi:MAG TPA: hypothetical protein VFA19_16015 [Gaiellaceae bacterium]|nr:hypothetical protein [Gaiellaceae bacterium]
MTGASLELLAPRADVWGFLAEPYHLSDWWPGLTGVRPDRRGFAPGARWQVTARVRNVILGSRSVETTLLVRDVEPFERWSWHLVASRLDVEVRLHVVADDRTEVTVATSRGPRSLPRLAVKRLYDLVQTAATL